VFSPHHLLAIASQLTTGEETTGLADQAAEVAQGTTERAGEQLSGIGELFSDVLGYLTSTMFVGNVVATAIVIVLALTFYRVASSLVPRILRWRRPEEETPSVAALARIKRQDTAITLVRNILRYVTFALVTLFVVSIFLRNVLPTIAGASILAAIVGFGAQSFIRDIIAGFFILFEGQYNVGDFVEVEPTKASGLVEEFGLRTTKIRALSGEIIYVPNGSLTGVTNYVSGQQRFTIEVQLKDEEAANRVLEEMKEGHGLYLVPPRLAGRDETPEGGPRLRLLASVLPSTAWLVEENLVERIKAAAGEEGLAADPLVYKVDSRNVQQLRNFIPER
jgi:moderate conductance mechanosensitive channel